MVKKTVFVVAAILLGAFVIGAVDGAHPFGDPGAAPIPGPGGETSRHRGGAPRS